MNLFDQVWPHLIGERYAILLRPHVKRLIRSTVLLLAGLVVLIAALAAFPNGVGLTVAGILVVTITISWWRSLAGIDRVGRQIQQDLAARGITVDKRAPLQNPRLYEQWLRRNGLSPTDVAGVSDGQ